MINENKIRRQALELARANREAEPGITEVYWFPHEEEVRLVEVVSDAPKSPDGKVRPFHFRASPEEGLPASSDVALISPEECGKAQLPEGWGGWNDAEKLEEAS
ncbi:MAG: hypothetical protein ACLFV7_09700 [Phycisphaerae bacterium]